MIEPTIYSLWLLPSLLTLFGFLRISNYDTEYPSIDAMDLGDVIIVTIISIFWPVGAGWLLMEFFVWFFKKGIFIIGKFLQKKVW